MNIRKVTKLNDKTIINLVPSYSEAPVSLEIFRRDTEQILKSLSGRNPENTYLIINKNESEKLGLKKNHTGLMENINLIETQDAGGFAFSNKSALIKVIADEKPFPSVKGIAERLEEASGSSERTVFISGKAVNKGMHTFDRMTTGRKILEAAGSVDSFKGIYLGYPVGHFISEENLDEEIELRTDYVEIYDDGSCMLEGLLEISKRFMRECCGRCVFGYEGVSQINMILNDISLKKGKPYDMGLLTDLCSHMKGQSLCESGECMADSVMSCLDSYEDEIREHASRKNCRSLACGRFVTYHILADKCTGCTDCIDACEDDSINGKKRFVHVIDQDECTQCGKCVAACDEGAIIRAGSVKPKCPSKPVPCKAK